MEKKVAKLLEEQVNKELYSAYLYLDFSNFCKHKGLDGFANWYEVQAKEEMDHAILFVKYLQNNNQAVALSAIAKPDVKPKTVMDVLKAGLKHEEYVTSLIHTIYGAAKGVDDFRTTQYLDWFVKEQGEEEVNANELVSKMELFGSDPRSLSLLANELQARAHSAPSLVM